MKKLILPLVLLGVAICIAGGAYVFLIYLQRPKVMDVIVAKETIPAGTTINEGMIDTIPWEGKMYPAGFISMKNKNKVIGRVAALDIYSGCPIVSGCMAPEGSLAGATGRIPEGMRALTVKVDEVSSVAGFIRPGSKVDILLAGAETPSEGNKEKGSKIILQNVQVLAAGQRITQLEGKDKPLVTNTVTLLLSPEEAEKVALATKMGTLLLMLRTGKDIASVKTRGSLPADVWGETTLEATAIIIEVIQGGVKTKITVEEKEIGGGEEEAEEEADVPHALTTALTRRL